MANAIINKEWIYIKRPELEVTGEHYKLVEQPLLPNVLKEGELLIRACYISVDPYMRIQQSALNTWEEPHPIGKVQAGSVVGEVIESLDHSIKVGDFVNCYTGWQLYAICPASMARKLDPEIAPISTALGVLGMPGRTAYFGLLEAGKPKPGETLVISGCAGAVGALVAQIGKLKGCRVVGLAGSDEKIAHLTDNLRVDYAINYKKHKTLAEMAAALEQACPNGIDIYFDNVGGLITDAVFHLINLRARIIICGQISQYSGGLDNPEIAPRFLHRILYTRATIQGILARDYVDRMPEMLEEMGAWVREGKIKYDETIIEGFENLPAALNSLFHGTNIGKLVVKV